MEHILYAAGRYATPREVAGRYACGRYLSESGVSDNLGSDLSRLIIENIVRTKDIKTPTSIRW